MHLNQLEQMMSPPTLNMRDLVLLDFLFTVKAALHECVIRTGQP